MSQVTTKKLNQHNFIDIIISICAAFFIMSCDYSQQQKHSKQDTPEIEYRSLSLATDGICILYKGGAIKCWPLSPNSSTRMEHASVFGSGIAIQKKPDNDVKLITLISETYMMCGIYTNGSWDCWANASVTTSQVAKDFHNQEVKDIKLNYGGFGICIAMVKGGIKCDNPQARVPTESAGKFDKILSYGANVKFIKVVLGSNQACGLSEEGDVECWPLDRYKAGISSATLDINSNVGQFSAPTALKFKALAAGLANVCGVTMGGSLNCWGAGKYSETQKERKTVTEDWHPRIHFGQSDPPDGKFQTVTCGKHHCCALATNRHISCWGLNNFGQASPPTQEFMIVVAGANSTCGITINDELECWGESFGGDFRPFPDSVR